MSRAFIIFGRAIGLWWDEFMLMLFLNIAWFAMQILIITGPPATAAMYAIAQQLAEKELVSVKDYFIELRRMILPAWKWGAANLLILIVIIVNFWAFQDYQGFGWSLIRLSWGTIGLCWFVINLFYWPFWLVQKDRSMQTTLRNSSLFLMSGPAFGLTLVLLLGIFIIGSILLTLPMITIMMSWIALIGVLAVNEELKRGRNGK